MTKLHTKGPWMLSGRTIMEDFGPLGSGRAIATVVGGYGSGPYFVEDPDEKRANASLIVAAPELLSAAVELQAALKEEAKERGGPWVGRQASRDTQRRVVLAHQALTAAVAKATGERE